MASSIHLDAGPDGALWFTEYGGDKIGRITTARAFTEYPLATPGAAPAGYYYWAGWRPLVHRATSATRSGGLPRAAWSLSSPAPAIQPGLDHLRSVPRLVVLGYERQRHCCSAPACALGLSASFADKTLTTNFDLGRRPVRDLERLRQVRKSWLSCPRCRPPVRSRCSHRSAQLVCSRSCLRRTSDLLSTSAGPADTATDKPPQRPSSALHSRIAGLQASFRVAYPGKAILSIAGASPIVARCSERASATSTTTDAIMLTSGDGAHIL